MKAYKYVCLQQAGTITKLSVATAKRTSELKKMSLTQHIIQGVIYVYNMLLKSHSKEPKNDIYAIQYLF